MKTLVYAILFIGLLFTSTNSYGCEWWTHRTVQPVVVVQPTVVQPVYVPVAVVQPVILQPVPVVEQRVVWVWPNYYQYPVYVRPTFIRY